MKRAALAAVALTLLAASAAAIPPGLLGVQWTVTRLAGAYTPPEYRPTVVFNEQGASGFTGCNQWEARFTGFAPNVRFGDMRVTEMACPTPVMQVEQRFLDGLRRMNSLRPDGPGVVLTDSSGREIMRLEP